MHDANKPITLNITLNDVGIILTALNELPHKTVSEVFAKVNAQTVAQLQPPAGDKQPE